MHHALGPAQRGLCVPFAWGSQDAIGGKRGDHPSHQGIYKQTLNQLLTEMDGLVKSGPGWPPFV